jgi:hypothetical protein
VAVRVQLGRTVFDAAWAHGQTLSIEQAIEFAMDEPLSDPQRQANLFPRRSTPSQATRRSGSRRCA